MIIFLYGPDTFGSRQKLKAIISRYQSIHKSGLALTKFNEENFDLDRFRERIKTISMFNEKKLIVLEDLLSTIISNSLLSDSKVDKNTIIVFWEREPDKKKKLFRWLKNNAQCQEFRLLETRKLYRWVKDKIKNEKAKIENEAVEKLVFYVGSDLWRMSNEIEKLIAFKKDKTIMSQDVELLTNPQIDINIFETTDALARGDKIRASELIGKHLSGGKDSSYLFSMILWQFRNLIKVKSGSTIGLHPFVVKKSTFLARRFTLEKLKSLYRYLLDIDLAIKTGRIEPRVALDLLVAET